MNKKCNNCGKELVKSRSYKLKRYCSSNCSKVAWVKRNKGKHRFICESCGKEFGKARKCRTGGTPYRYCSRKCSWNNKKGVRRVKGGTLSSSGYVMGWAPSHPKARNSRVLEHRLVVEKIIGRYLKETEYVHHKDGNRTNNNPDNLLIVNKQNHAAAISTHRDRAEVAEQFIVRKGLWKSFLQDTGNEC